MHDGIDLSSFYRIQDLTFLRHSSVEAALIQRPSWVGSSQVDDIALTSTNITLML